MANEKRLIDANSLVEFLKEQKDKETGAYSKGRNNGINVAIGAIRNEEICPTVEVAHGHWVRLDAHKGIEQFKCSVCRSECYVPTCMNEPMYDYCPNCGAKMDGDGNV